VKPTSRAGTSSTVAHVGGQLIQSDIDSAHLGLGEVKAAGDVGDEVVAVEHADVQDVLARPGVAAQVKDGVDRRLALPHARRAAHLVVVRADDDELDPHRLEEGGLVDGDVDAPQIEGVEANLRDLDLVGRHRPLALQKRPL
jgi:hypothetical protein